MADDAQAKDDKSTKPEGEGEGAPAAAEADVAAAAAAAKKKRMMLVMSAITAVVGVIVAVGVVFFMGGEKKAEGEHHEESAVAAAVVDVPEFTVNLLADGENNSHFMKIKLAVEVARKEDEANVATLMPRLQDDWGGFMRQLRPSDMQGSAALQRLKEGLLRRANQSLAPVPVKAVYIRELLVQ